MGIHSSNIWNKEAPLDYEITLEDTMDAHKYLQQGKTPGLHNITNEMLICSVKFYLRIFLYVFHHILKHGGQIPSWVVSLLVPIYKKGNSNDRGISLGSPYFHA